MDKLRSFTEKMKPSGSGSGSKLSKAFQFDKEHKVLGGNLGSGDVFRDGPQLEEPSLTRVQLYLYCAALFFTFLSLCMMIAVAAFQGKWFKVSGGTGFTLFLVILALLLGLFLLLVPIAYDRWDRCRRAAQFLGVPRASMIVHGFGSLLMLLAAFIVTISAWTAKGCKDADNDPHASLGDSYKNGLKDFCNTKKASAMFDWFALIAWMVLLAMAVLAFRRERRRDPRFIAPPETGISYANVDQHIGGSGGPSTVAAEDPYADKHEVVAPAGSVTGYESYGYTRAAREEDEAFGRPSMEAYGAFEGRGSPVGRADEGSSRTMQHAHGYADPYAPIRTTLISESMVGAYPQSPAPYQSPHTPQPQTVYATPQQYAPPTYSAQSSEHPLYGYGHPPQTYPNHMESMTAPPQSYGYR